MKKTNTFLRFKTNIHNKGNQVYEIYETKPSESKEKNIANTCQV